MRARLERLVGYLRIGGLQAAVPLLQSIVSDGYHVARIRRRDIRHPFYIRVRTSDYSCFRQVFELQEYALDARWQPKTIIDAGANIGLASIYFANAFPSSRIIAIEPERENFRLLEANCAPYSNIEPVHAALWSEDKDLHVCDIGNGEWGFVTQTKREKESLGSRVHDTVRGTAMPHLLDDFGVDQVDILKVDIEGSETEVLSGRPEWIKRVGVLIIETHDRLKPGCELAVVAATPAFEFRWQTGENLVFAREGACIARPISSKAESQAL